MSSRLKLQEELENLLGSDKVYFQPPPSVKMTYPCIVYSRPLINSRHADNKPYLIVDEYEVIYIDDDPDSEMIHKLAEFPQCAYQRQYKTNELYHNVYRLTY